MNIILNYLKHLGTFLIFIVIITFLSSLINLSGFNSILISKLTIILTALSFFFISLKASHNSKEKGVILGLKLGLFCILILVIANIILYSTPFKIDRIIYYTILLIASILGGIIGKNRKPKTN